MPDLPLTKGNYGRSRVDLPQLRLLNAYIESSPGGPSSEIRTTRPGLTARYSLGQGPILAMFESPGLFNGDLFTVSGSDLYRNDTLIGTVAYSQNPIMAGTDGYLVVVSGGGLYIYDGTTLTAQLYFDDGTTVLPQFSGVTVLDNIFIYPLVGSNQFYTSNVGNPGTIPALNLSLANVYPDSIVQMYILAEQLYIFKNTTTEIWYFNGGAEPAAPFTLQQGATMARGCASQASVRKLDNALFWIGDDFTVYRTGNVPTRVSTSFIEDEIRQCAKAGYIAQVTAFTSNIEGHVHYVINLPGTDKSYAYDCQTQEWSQWGTLNGVDTDPGIFAGAYAAGQGEDIFVGSYKDGNIWVFDVNNHTDDGVKIQVIVTGQILLSGGVQKCTNISLHCVRGTATSTTPEPIIEMRYSDDGGRTFTSWIQGHAGGIGAYYYKACWRSLGIMKQPGRVIEFKISDSVNVTIEGGSFNEARV